MIKISTKQRRTTGKFLKKVIAAGALSACSFAQAYVLNFEQEVDSPIVYSGDYIQFGQFWVQSFGGELRTDMVGAIIDGRDNDTCVTISCPVNNKSHYYAGLDDGYFYFGMNDNANFRVQSLQASFIGAQGGTYPATAGMLVLQGFNAAGSTVGSALQLGLAGANAKGEFNFGTYSLGAFGNNTVNYVRVLGYVCDNSGNCNRTSDLANFAIDNIVTVPEPTTMALFGLGIAGVAAFARRRRA